MKGQTQIKHPYSKLRLGLDVLANINYNFSFKGKKSELFLIFDMETLRMQMWMSVVQKVIIRITSF